MENNLTPISTKSIDSKKYKALKKAIQDGIDSGITNNFNPKTHLKELKQRKKVNE